MSEDVLEVKNVTKSFFINKQKGIFNQLPQIRTNKDRVQLEGMKKNREKIKALDNVSFVAKKGEFLGIIGLNGSGKSTLLQIISGIYQPDSGSVKVDGMLAPILQIGTGFNQELMPHENIVIYGMLLGLEKKEIENKVETILDFAELKNFSRMRLKHFSSGMRARLAFSTILQLNPDILLIDEILSVGDINFREKSTKAFLSFKEKGKTILLTTHQLGVLNDLADRVILLHKGKILNIGDPQTVIQQYKDLHQSPKKFKT